MEKLGYDSGGDFAADLFLGASDWGRARQGFEEDDWGKLLSGAGMGALAVGSLVPAGLMTRGGRAALQAKMAPRMGDEFVDGALGANLGGGGGAPSTPRARGEVDGRLIEPDPVDDWMPGGMVDTGLGPVPEAIPGVRDSWTTESIGGARERLAAQRGASLEANALANPEYLDDLARMLSQDDSMDAIINQLAPLGEPYRRKGTLQRLPSGSLYEATAQGAVRAGSGRRVGSPLSSPLDEGGMGLTPSPYNRPELALPVLAAQVRAASGSAKGAARQEFTREFARQGQSMFSMVDSTIGDGPLFYLDRAAQMRAAAGRALTPEGEAAFSPQVIAASTAASSSNAAPIDEPARLLMALPFVRMKDGKAVFDEVSREAFRAKHGALANASMHYNGARAFADALNNPNFLNRKIPGLGHKTTPYAVLGVDPENPWAFVADRNLWYLAQAHNRRGTFGNLGDIRGGGGVSVGEANPMGPGLVGSAGTSLMARAIGAGTGATPATVQEVIWFAPRIVQQPDIADSFAMSPFRSQGADTFMRNRMGDKWMDDLYQVKNSKVGDNRKLAEAKWSEILGEALESAGSHFEDATELRRLGARTSREFREEVSAGRVDGWQMLDGEAVPDRSKWRATLAVEDRYVDDTVDAATAAGGIERVDVAQRTETGAYKAVERIMEEMVGPVAQVLKKMSEQQVAKVTALVASGVAAERAVRMVQTDRGEVTDADVQELLDGMDDFETGWA